MRARRALLLAPRAEPEPQSETQPATSPGAALHLDPSGAATEMAAAEERRRRAMMLAEELNGATREGFGRRTGQTVRPALAALDTLEAAGPAVVDTAASASVLTPPEPAPTQRKRSRPRPYELRARAALEHWRTDDATRAELSQVSAEREELARRLVLSQTDLLTGTYTRAAGLEALDREVTRCHRTHTMLVIAYIDVVGLKTVNDREGHAAGDVLLKTVIRHVRGQLRPYDLVIRLGGDEFLCAMSSMSQRDARRRFADVSATLAAAPVGGAIRTGFAELAPDEDALELIARADGEMVSGRQGANDPRWATSLFTEGDLGWPAPALSLALAGGPLAPARARAALGAFTDEIGPAQLAMLRLMVTELVSNSVVHGGAGESDRIAVQITVRRGTIHGEVSDGGPGFTPHAPVAERETGGLGLVILSRAASRWGTTHDGRRVWFELLHRSPIDELVPHPRPERDRRAG
jgi:diguanylate cyclase (GGDEF)-like protein